MPVAIENHMYLCGGSSSGKTVGLKIWAESYLTRMFPVIAFDTLNNQGDITGLTIPITHAAAMAAAGFPAGIDPALASERTNEGLGQHITIAQTISKRLLEVVAPRVIAPYTDRFGERLSIPPLTSRPHGYDTLIQNRTELVEQADAVAAGFLQRMGLARRGKDGVDHVRNVICEAIVEAWEQDLPMDGAEGIGLFLNFFQSFNEAYNERTNGAGIKASTMTQIHQNGHALTMGKDREWLDGTPLNMQSLLTAPRNKVPLIIVRLCHLPPEDRPWIVGRIINSAINHCSKQGDPRGKPRLGILVDELGSEPEPEKRLLAPLTYSGHPSSNAIRSGLRRGRHAGVTMALGSQSPRDIDSKNFNNVRVRLIGRVTTKEDAVTALQGSDLSSEEIERLADKASSLKPGSLFYAGPLVTAGQPRGRTSTPTGEPRLATGSPLCRMRLLGTGHFKVSDEGIAGLQRIGLIARTGARIDPRKNLYDDLTSLSIRHASLLPAALAKAIATERDKLAAQLGEKPNEKATPPDDTAQPDAVTT